jgi:hypothetical protein
MGKVLALAGKGRFGNFHKIVKQAQQSKLYIYSKKN